MKPLLLLPAYNERETLFPLLDRVREQAARVFVVDDGSTDGSGELLEQRSGDWCRVVRLARNRGKSVALAAGLRAVARALEEEQLDPESLLVLLDADGQHPAEILPELCAWFQNGSWDMLIGARELSGTSWLRRLALYLATWQARWLTGVAYRDTLCGLRVLRAGRALELARYLSGPRYTCEQEMCVRLPLAGWKVCNDFSFRPPSFRSNPTPWDGLQILWLGFRAWLQRR